MVRRRVRKIQLLFTGAAVIATAGCGEQPRYVYANLQDCMTEWELDDCEPQANGTFIAPDDDWAYSHRKTTSTSKAIKTVKRGGFGSFARSFGGSRS